MAGCSITFAVLALLALSGRTERVGLNVLTTESAGMQFTGDFFAYDGKFEQQDKIETFNQVKELQTLKDRLLRGTFSSSPTNKHNMDIASKDIHVAIAVEMLDNLKQSSAQVMDLGCGTGALMAVLIELASSNCTGCKVEGIENDATACQRVQGGLGLLLSYPFWKKGILEKVKQVPVALTCGNAFGWNEDGTQDGKYQVINVGFAVSKDTLAGTRWLTALAEGGKLVVPFCTTNPPEVDEKGRCNANFHVFTQGNKAAEIWNEDVNFMYISPP